MSDEMNDTPDETRVVMKDERIVELEVENQRLKNKINELLADIGIAFEDAVDRVEGRASQMQQLQAQLATVTQERDHTILLLAKEVIAPKSLSPMTPVPQWMPEGWVPVEPGAFWVNDGVSSSPVKVMASKMTPGHLYFLWGHNIGEQDFANYRWCPLPGPPEIPQ